MTTELLSVREVSVGYGPVSALDSGVDSGGGG